MRRTATRRPRFADTLLRRLGTAGLLAGGLLIGGVAAPAWAQMDSREGIALQNQILELRRDLQAVQAQASRNPSALAPPVPRGGGGGGAVNEISAQLLDRVTSLEDQVRRLQGQLDEQANANRRARDDLAKQIADMNFRAQNASGPSQPAGPVSAGTPGLAGPGSATSGSGLAAPAGPVQPARRPPELALHDGNTALTRRDYAAAEAAAREVLAGPRGPRATDGQYLLAQALTGKRDFPGAAIAYDDAYNRARTGPRAADSLVGLANAMLMLNDRGSACQSLDKLRAEFPTARGDVRESAAALRGRAGCR